MAANIGIMLAINLAVKGISLLIGEVDKYINRLDIARDALSETECELNSVDSEIANIGARIKELESMGTLSLTDKEELERLREENRELAIRKKYLEDIKAQESEDVVQYAKEKMDYKYGDTTSREDIDAYKQYMKNPEAYNGTYYESDALTIKLAQYERYQELKQQAVENEDWEAIELIDKNLQQLEESLIADRTELQGFKDDLSLTGESSAELDNVNQKLKFIDDLLLAPSENLKNFLNSDAIANDVSKLKELASNGELTEEKFKQSFSAINSYLEENNLSFEDLISTLEIYRDELNSTTQASDKFTKTEMIDTINSMADGFDVLDDIYADVLDGETFDFTKLDTSKFSEAFSEITPEYEKFIETVSSSPTDIDACQGAFNDLVSAFIDSKGILSGLTEENKDLTISMLQNMGVANAEEIVMAQLAMQTEALALQEQFTTENGYELAEATYAEALEFINEAECSAVAKQELAELALEKIHVNEQTIDTSADIENVIALANAANASALAISKLKSAQTVMSSYESGGLKSGAISMMDVREAQKVIDSIENGSFNYDYQPLKASDYLVTSNSKYTPKYSGADQTASAIEKANKSASDSAKDASEEAKKAYSDWFDFMDIRVEKLDDAFANLEKGMENVVGAFAKNQLVDAQLGIVNEEINNYTDALAMYKQQAQNVLSTIEDANLRDKIVNGAVELSQIQGENADVVKSAMEAYQNWSGKIAECNHKLEELRTQIRQLELAKFENIIEDYTNQFDLYGDSIDLIKGQIGLLEEAGELVGKNYYTTQITQSEKQLATLEKQKADMIKQMTDAIDSGRIQRGTDEWLEMQKSLSSVESEIINVKTNIEELNNDLQELNWSIFERVHTEFGNLNSELENLAGLFDDFNDIKVSDGKGNWTDEAISTLGLYIQQYELARYQANSYSEAIDKLNEDFQNGDYSATEYMDKLASLKQEQWNCVESAESLEDTIVSLNKTRVDEEIETIEELIDKYKEYTDSAIEALDAKKDLHDYEKSIKDKTGEIEALEREIASMKNDTSASTTALRLQKEESLAKLKSELEEMEYEHSIQSQKDALNAQLENFEAERNAEIEALRLSLENRELLISQSFETVKANASTVGEQIALIAQQHGVTVSDAIITSWANGETAIASYGETLSAQSSAFIGNIMGVEAEVYNLQTQADNSSIALANMFATRADNLVGQLQASYMAEGNLNYATGVLQNSLVNTLERGYNIGGITSALSGIESGLNSVASAAQSAYDNIQKTLGAQASVPKYKLVDTRTDEVLATGSSWSDVNKVAQNKYLGVPNLSIQAFAKGGIVKKDENILTPIAKALGEDTMVAVKYDEVVLNKKQTSMLQNLASVAPDIEQMWNIPNYSVQTPVMHRNERPNITINYDSMLHVDNFTDAPHLIGAIESTSKKVTTKILNDINRDFRIHSR